MNEKDNAGADASRPVAGVADELRAARPGPKTNVKRGLPGLQRVIGGWTIDPDEAEVSEALSLYKLALINARYRNWVHRLLCWLKKPEALEHERLLTVQEKVCRETVNQSSEHQDWVILISSRQPDFERRKDNFTGLLDDRET